MAHHENYLDGRQADQQGFDRRLVRALLLVEVDHQDPLDALGLKGLSDQRKIWQSLCLLGFVEAGPEFRLGG